MQLPRRLAIHLQSFGHDALHTLELPSGNRTTDNELNQLSRLELRILITKDTDFVNSFLLNGQPYKLLLIATGNISNVDLLSLFDQHLPRLETLYIQSDFVEMNRDGLVLHT